MNTNKWNWMNAVVVGCVLAGMIGCGGDNADSMIAELNSTNSKRLANLYSLYQINHNWQGPNDETELRKFIESLSPNRLKRGGIELDQLDQLFISERDGQPFKIRWGLVSRVRGPSLPVVFEEVGVDGKRQIGFTNSAMQEVDSSEYDRLWKIDPKDLDAPQENRGGQR